MRTRGIVAVIAAGALFAGAAPALAGKNLTVKPNPVKQGKKLKVIASNCVSGPGYTAYVDARIDFPMGDTRNRAIYKESEGDPTKIAFKMKPRTFLPDRYKIQVKCVHELDDGTIGIWWDESDSFRVKRRVK